MNRSQERRREALIEQQALGALDEAEALELAVLTADTEEDQLRKEQLATLWQNVRIALRARKRGLMREVAVGSHQFTPPLSLAEIALRCPVDIVARVDEEREVVVFQWREA